MFKIYKKNCSRLVVVLALTAFAAVPLNCDFGGTAKSTTNNSGNNNTVRSLTVRGKVNTGLINPQALAGGRVALISPGNGNWVRLLFGQNSKLPNIVKTGADGSYTYKIQYFWFESTTYEIFYVMVTDATGNFTLLAEIPENLVAENADINLDINPQTTAAGLWHCPHGDFSTPSYACPVGVTCQYPGGAPCYQNPNDSTDTTALLAAIDAAVDAGHIAEPNPNNWDDFSTDLLAETDVLDALNDILNELGFWDITPQGVAKEIEEMTMPKIPEPTYMDNNDGSCGSQGNLCPSGQTCVSLRHCIPSIFDDTCSCSPETTDGACRALSVACSTSDGLCGNGTNACCQGYTCVNSRCQYRNGECP